MFFHKTRTENEWARADLQEWRELLPGWDPGPGKHSPPVILIHIKSECAKVRCVRTLRHWPREYENLWIEVDLSVWVNNGDRQWQDAGGEEKKVPCEHGRKNLMNSTHGRRWAGPQSRWGLADRGDWWSPAVGVPVGTGSLLGCPPVHTHTDRRKSQRVNTEAPQMQMPIGLKH